MTTRKRSRPDVSGWDGYGNSAYYSAGGEPWLVFDRDGRRLVMPTTRDSMFPEEPPRPTKPSAAEMSNNFSSRHVRRDQRHTLRFATLEELKLAVLAYAGEVPRSRIATIREIETASGGMAAVLADMHLPSSGGTFAQRVVQAIGNLDGERGYRGSWDYDGPGPFHKASLSADRNPDGTFSLSVSAARAEPEPRLAAAVGAPLGFARSEFEIMWAPPEGGSDRFRIPVAGLVAILQTVAPGATWNSDEFLACLKTPTVRQDDSSLHDSPVTLFGDGDIEAKIRLHEGRNVPLYQRRSNPGRDYELRIEDGYLTGPASLDREFGMPRSAALEMDIRPSAGLCYDKEIEARILAIADRVGNTLSEVGLPHVPFRE